MTETRSKRSRRLAATAVILCALTAILASAAAGSGSHPTPTYEVGAPSSKIESATAAEEFSYEIGLSAGQSMRPVSEAEVEVVGEDGSTAYDLVAGAAHDVNGKVVPSTLRIADADTVTLTVRHREGDPAAGGAPFSYPIVVASGWRAGITPGTTFVETPPDEAEIAAAEEAKREAERLAGQRAAAEAATPPPAPLAVSPPPAPTCAVPSLRGLRLAAAKARLRGSHCAVGRVHLRAGSNRRSAKVVRQSRDPGTVLPAGAPVVVILGSG